MFVPMSSLEMWCFNLTKALQTEWTLLQRRLRGRQGYLFGDIRKRVGVINCHNTSSSTGIIYDFLTSAFAAAIRLQTGGTDSSGQKIKPMDAIKTELVLRNFKDTKRKYEIDYLMTNKNLANKGDLVCDLPKDIVPCELWLRPENLNCDWLQLKSNVTYAIHAREAVPAVLEHRRSLRC
uniref:Uncharacterized protein n=1 Tax=Tetranychus urticae TaxID=32264 RepID=T1L5H4_TETUR